MFYGQIVVVAETKNEVMRIIGELYNQRRRQFADKSEDLYKYWEETGEHTGGVFIIKENPTHDYERPLEKHLDDMS